MIRSSWLDGGNDRVTAGTGVDRLTEVGMARITGVPCNYVTFY